MCESIPLVSIPFQNDVGLVCVNFATSILNCCRVIDNMHFYIAKVQATMFACFFLLANMLALFSIHLVLPFKWFERDFKGMFHITYLPSSMNMSLCPLHPFASFNSSFVHFLFSFIAMDLLIFYHLVWFKLDILKIQF